MVSALLFSVTLNGTTIPSGDLPTLDTLDVSVVMNPANEPYALSPRNIVLRRFRMASAVYFDSYVKRTDLAQITVAITNTYAELQNIETSRFQNILEYYLLAWKRTIYTHKQSSWFYVLFVFKFIYQSKILIYNLLFHLLLIIVQTFFFQLI